MSQGIFRIATLALLATVGTANAGGFARGTADTEILYEEGNFNIRSGLTYVSPSRKFTKHGNPALIGTDYTEAYVIPSAAVKLNVSDDFRCAGTFTNVFGGNARYAAPTLSGKLSEEFNINEWALTCGYKFDLSKGRLWLLGGVFLDAFDYNRANITSGWDQLR